MTKPTKKRSLTVKQQRFVDIYDGNATDAAQKAGYKGNYNTLHSVGVENLQKPAIRAAIKAREKKRNQTLIADREERQRFWTDILRKEMTRMGIIGKGEFKRLVEIDPKFKEMLKASELLGRSEADFTDKLTIGIDDKSLGLILAVLPEQYALAVRSALMIAVKDTKLLK